MLSTHYPHIHSLSTLGIIYHGNYDYELNPWCTSFAGESGLGKSIIADLLQLIFVGPQKGIYESATQSTEERPPEGLVLGDEQSRAKGIGYAFVTIAKAASSYLTIGCYLEAGSHALYPFIVQQSHDFTRDLICFNRPLGYQDFLDADGMILPYRDCRKHLEKQHHIIAKFYTTHFTAYHDCLYRNHVLPLDAGGSLSNLRSYAKIIRSFARSGDLVKKDVDLKDFLFGTEKEKAIREEYDRRVKKMMQDQADYQRNSHRISETTDRVANLRELQVRQRVMTAAQRRYLVAEVVYARQQAAQTQQAWQVATAVALELHLNCYQGEAEQLRQTVATARAAVLAYNGEVAEQAELTTQLSRLQEASATAEQEFGRLQAQLETSKKQVDGIKQVKHWMSLYGTGAAELYEQQRQHLTWRQQRQELERFEAHLEAGQVWQAFEQSAWAAPVEAGEPLLDLVADVAQMQTAVAEARRWRAFADLDDPDSLATWALHHGQPLTEEQESILAHFSRFTHFREQEKKGSRYLDNPKKLLFDGRLTYEAGRTRADGFWLDLEGVREWVQRLPAEERIFAEFDRPRIRQQFLRRHQQVEALEEKLEQAQTLLNALETPADWPKFLPLYVQREIICRIPEQELLPADLQALNNQLEWLANAAESMSRHQYHDAQLRLHTILAEARGQEKNQLESRQANLVVSLADTLLAREQRVEEAVQKQAAHYRQWQDWQLAATMPDSIYAQLQPLLDVNADVDTTEPGLEQRLTIVKGKILEADATVKQAFSACKQQRELRQQAEANYLDALKESPPATDELAEPAAKPTTEEWHKCRDDYRQQFTVLVASYLGSASVVRYDPDRDLLSLMQAALSDSLEELAQADSDELLDQAERHLRSINERNAQIAERKMQLLGEVFEQVEIAVDEYQTEVNRISKYFQRGKMPITGGLRPVLKAQPSKRFSLEWLGFFRKVLRNKDSGDSKGFQELVNLEGMDGLMRGAFEEYGPERNSATVSELLNPKSYLELRYYMAFPNGDPNKGSTGQTFMLAALLNVARLSIIGRDRPGIRFMAIDEAHGLGGNFTTLLRLARTGSEKYQIISLSPEPLLNEAASQQRQYSLLENPAPNSRLNLRPMRVDKVDLSTDLPSSFPTSLFDNEPDEQAPVE